MHLKMSSAKWRLFGLGLNELKNMGRYLTSHVNCGMKLPIYSNYTSCNVVWCHDRPRSVQRFVYWDKLAVGQISFAQNTHFNCETVLKIYTEYDSDTAVFCAKFQNGSSYTRIVPEQTKIERVVPIYKHGDPSQFNNCRPMSVLNVFSKVYGRLCYDHLLLHLKKHKILYES